MHPSHPMINLIFVLYSVSDDLFLPCLVDVGTFPHEHHNIFQGAREDLLDMRLQILNPQSVVLPYKIWSSERMMSTVIILCCHQHQI